ncbi:MAG: DNA-directed RNA polymerase subunit alpha C-terminal domain-containing protein [Minisyncoccia bacterium]
MSSEPQSDLDFKTAEERNEFLKIRIDSVGFSPRVEHALTRAGVRTLGGIFRKKESALLQINGLGIRGVNEIKAILKNQFDLSIVQSKSREENMNSLPTFAKDTNTAEVRVFLDEPIETLGLSARTNNALGNTHIRTVGGLIRKKISELLNISGLGEGGVSEIQLTLRKVFNMSVEPKEEDPNENPSKTTPLNSGKEIFLPSFFTAKKGELLDNFASYFNIKKEALREHSRKKDGIGEIRDIIIYLLREYGEMSFPAIGRLLIRDHTTIIHAYRKIKARTSADADFEKTFSDLIQNARSIKEKKKYIEQTIIPRITESVRFERNRPKVKEIPKQNAKVLELYREGLTAEDIAKIIKVSRQRIYQIVDNTIRQLAINDSVSKGIDISADVLIEEEKKKRSNIRLNSFPMPIKKEREKRWSVYYVACKSCGTTSIPHVRKGFCEQCIGNFRGDRREDIIAQHSTKCDSCQILRQVAINEQGRDFYITKDRQVLCRKCFLKTTGKTLGSYKNYEWSRHYEKCIKCGTQSVRHAKNGLCENCAEVFTNSKRNRIITEHAGRCDECGMTREEAHNKYNRDLHTLKSGKVLCRRCFLKNNMRKARMKS